MKTIILIITFTFLGCANNSAPLIEYEPEKTVSLGMSKKELQEIKGDPERMAARNGFEYLIFIEQRGIFTPADHYYYRFNNGKLDEFGSLRDFRTDTVNVNFQ